MEFMMGKTKYPVSHFDALQFLAGHRHTGIWFPWFEAVLGRI